MQVDDVTVSDDDVDEQVEALRERFATLKDVERPAQDGDVATIDLKATRDGEPVEGGEVSGYSYKVGSGDMLEGIDDALRGLSAGEEKTFTSQLLGGDLSGEDVEVTVKLSAVKEQELPELDDDFAQTASEFDTIEELREDVAPGSSAASASSRPPPPATPCSSSCSTPPRSRSPRASSPRSSPVAARRSSSSWRTPA